MFKSKKQKIFICLIIVITLSFLMIWTLSASSFAHDELPAFTTISKYVDSNRHTHPDDEREATNQVPLFSDPTIINTEMGQIYLDEESLAFQFYNERNYLWSSTIDYESSSLSPNWKRRVRSAVHIEAFNTKSDSYATVEEFVLSEGTTKTTRLIENGFESRITFGRSRISLLLRVTFTSKGIEVEIPDEEIEETDSFKLFTVKLYPFFGAVLEDSIPGYIFIPDGIGALVRYKKADSIIIANYQKEIYGRNLGYSIDSNLNKTLLDGNTIQAPVFGFVHGVNQNAVFGNILSGAEYGNLNIYYAGKTTNYTTVFPEFVYRRTYKQPIDRAGNTISLLQNYRNEINLKVLYTPLSDDDANYMGMAKLYRQQLDIESQEQNYGTIPLKLETIGLEKSTGLLFNKKTIMTSFTDYYEMILDLKTSGINNIVGVFAGYTDQGASWAPPEYSSLSRKLGGEKAFKQILSEATKFYLVNELVKASSKGSGYSLYSDLASKINDQDYVYENLTDKKYLVKHQKTGDLFRKSTEAVKEYGVGLALPTIGNLLYADYKGKFYLEDAILYYQELLSEADTDIALSKVNAYLWKQIDAYFDFPMYSSQYLQFSDTVPFLAIVLSGAMPLFGGNANFYPYARDELLRLVDFGVYPSFLVTEKSSKYFKDTEFEYIFSSRYQDLKPAILTYYDFVNGALKNTIKAKIEDRKVLDTGLVQVDYDNGISILINYTENAKTLSGMQILPKNYMVISEGEIISSGYREVEDE